MQLVISFKEEQKYIHTRLIFGIYQNHNQIKSVNDALRLIGSNQP